VHCLKESVIFVHISSPTKEPFTFVCVWYLNIPPFTAIDHIVLYASFITSLNYTQR